MITSTSYVRPAGPWDTNAAPLAGFYGDPMHTGADVEPAFGPAFGVYGDDGQAERNAAMKAEAEAAHRRRQARDGAGRRVDLDRFNVVKSEPFIPREDS